MKGLLKMKKLLSIILVVFMLFSLAACAGPEEESKEMTPAEKAKAEAEIRYAIGLLFDRNYIVNDIAQGGQVPASSFVAMGMTDADGSILPTP